MFYDVHEERQEVVVRAVRRKGTKTTKEILLKVVALGEAKNSLSEYVDQAQQGRVLVTRHGKPAALIMASKVRTSRI